MAVGAGLSGYGAGTVQQRTFVAFRRMVWRERAACLCDFIRRKRGITPPLTATGFALIGQAEKETIGASNEALRVGNSRVRM